MTKLDRLIAELCPDGVEYKTLGEIGMIIRGSGLPKSDFTESGVPCIHYGQIYTYYGAFATQTKSFVSLESAAQLKRVNKGDIIIAVTSENLEDVCKCVVWLGDEDIVTGGHTAILKHNQNPKYIAYWLQTKEFFKQKRLIAHGTKVIEVIPSKLNNVKLPIPSLLIQQEIVRILDNYAKLATELTTELTAELTARKKQYEYYRDELLTFGEDVPMVALGEISTITRGVRLIRSQLAEEGKYPVYQNSMNPLGYYEKSNSSANTVFLISAGAAGEIGYSTVEFWAADDCFCFVCSKRLQSRYLYYALLCQQNYIFSRVRKASVPRLARSVVEQLHIPLPPLEEQARIVDILDDFDALTNDIICDLPDEIEARSMQYEYYRDKLLTFKEKTG